MTTEARDAWNAHLGSCLECSYGPKFCDDGWLLVQKARDERDLHMELWSLTSTGPVFGEVRGAQIFQTHPRSVCEPDGFPCCLHSPSEHHMKDWPMLWRADRALMERTCPHGVGHPDPDDLAFHKRNGNDWQGAHGCDFCCSPDPTKRRSDVQGS